jgi:hypothetical protein
LTVDHFNTNNLLFLLNLDNITSLLHMYIRNWSFIFFFYLYNLLNKILMRQTIKIYRTKIIIILCNYAVPWSYHKTSPTNQLLFWSNKFNCYFLSFNCIFFTSYFSIARSIPKHDQIGHGKCILVFKCLCLINWHSLTKSLIPFNDWIKCLNNYKKKTVFSLGISFLSISTPCLLLPSSSLRTLTRAASLISISVASSLSFASSSAWLVSFSDPSRSYPPTRALANAQDPIRSPSPSRGIWIHNCRAMLR